MYMYMYVLGNCKKKIFKVFKIKNILFLLHH